MAGSLPVSGRAVARHWSVSEEVVRLAADAGLLPRSGSGFDAATSLELGRRPWVTAPDLAGLSAGSVVVVQQGPIRMLHASHPDLTWRRCYGWGPELTPAAALASASGWWQLNEQRRSGALGVVATVATFVVTIGVIDPERALGGAQSGGYIRFNLLPAGQAGAWGRHLLDAFDGRRLPRRRGTPAFPLPDPVRPGASAAADA